MIDDRNLKPFGSLKDSKQAAIDAGDAKYVDLNGCRECEAADGDARPRVRFVNGDHCLNCMSRAADQVWQLWEQGMPGRPEPWSSFVNRNPAVSWIYGMPHHSRVCQNGPHLRKTHLKGGHCVECEGEAKDDDRRRTPDSIMMEQCPDMVVSREDARALGIGVYRTGEACRRGHTGYRYVLNGACIDCLRGNHE